jgi:basic amino acid/polyamine antiporter, APA family
MKRTTPSNVVQIEKPALKRVLGVKDLFAIGYGDLGSSIYYALGITALYALGATPIALALAGIVFICTALTYAEMTSMFHESGGSASFARHAFNDLVSFVSGWGLLLDYIVTIAISAFAIAPYLSYFHSFLGTLGGQTGFTIAIIAMLFLLNFVGVKQSTRVSFVLTSGTLITQGLIFLIALFCLPTLIERFIARGAIEWPSWPDFWRGTAMAMVAYTGIESIAQLGAEAKRPSKNVPKAVFITMGFLVVAYLLLSMVAMVALTPEDLSTKYLQDPIAGIVAALPFGGKILGPWVGILAAALLLVAANAGLVGSSRLAFNMGEYYQLPRSFYRIHERFRTPYIALAFFAVVAILIVLWSRGKMMFLADLYNFGAMIAFFSAHISLIVMRIKRPDLKRPVRIPFNIRIGKSSIPISAIIGALATLGVWILIVITKKEGRYLGLIWMSIGLVMYFAYRHSKKFSAVGSLTIEKVKMPEFQPFEIKEMLVVIHRKEHTGTVQMACEFAKLHEARVKAVYAIEVPFSLPLDAKLVEPVMTAKVVLKKTEAIAQEFNLKIETEVVRGRSVSDVILAIVKEEHFDLVVLESMHPGSNNLGADVERIVKEAPCRVWVCASAASEKMVTKLTPSTN